MHASITGCVSFTVIHNVFIQRLAAGIADDCLVVEGFRCLGEEVAGCNNQNADCCINCKIFYNELNLVDK